MVLVTLSLICLSHFCAVEMYECDKDSYNTHNHCYTCEGEEYSSERSTVLSETALIQAVLDTHGRVVSY